MNIFIFSDFRQNNNNFIQNKWTLWHRHQNYRSFRVWNFCVFFIVFTTFFDRRCVRFVNAHLIHKMSLPGCCVRKVNGWVGFCAFLELRGGHAFSQKNFGRFLAFRGGAHHQQIMECILPNVHKRPTLRRSRSFVDHRYVTLIGGVRPVSDLCALDLAVRALDLVVRGLDLAYLANGV